MILAKFVKWIIGLGNISTKRPPQHQNFNIPNEIIKIMHVVLISSVKQMSIF